LEAAGTADTTTRAIPVGPVTLSLVPTKASTVSPNFPRRPPKLLSETDTGCSNFPGIKTDGGYAEYCTLDATAVAHVPVEADVAKTAPLFCAGVTVFNSMRNMGSKCARVHWGFLEHCQLT
jgi:NADPH:quinone reductase-like Zn-dependent oxidoreductase